MSTAAIELDDNTSEFFTLTVSGDNYQRGYQHGKALRKIIRPAVNRFKYELITELLKLLEVEKNYWDYHDYLLCETGLLKVAQKEVPDLVDEIQGIADGAGLPFEDVFVYNLNFDEMFWVLEKMTGVDPILVLRKAEYEKVHGHCSLGSIWETGQASVAYTLDWVRTFEGTQTLIQHVLPSGDVLLLTTYAGTLIGHGINATHGYTYTPHSKFQLSHDVDGGLAQIFIYRKLVEAGSVASAIKVLEAVRPAAGLGYTLTDFNGTRAFELSSGKMVEVDANVDSKAGTGWTAMANVARVNNDLSSSNLSTYELTESELPSKQVDMKALPALYWEYNEDSVDREALLEKALAKACLSDMTPARWEQVFSEYPLNKPVGEEMETTNLWHVVEIDSSNITYHVSPGNPGKFPLETYRFTYR